MKRGVLLLFLFVIVSLLHFVSAEPINDEIQKITHYAQEYETGNIDYAQFIVYQSEVRQKLNGLLGATERQEGGVLREEQIRQVLGEPKEMTNWIWVEKEERERKLDKEVPAWEKIVFDGEKIQIRLNAYPSLLKKGDEEKIVYHLNFWTEFKRPKEQIDILSRIDEIKVLADIFAKSPDKENGEKLAKESVNVEKIFEKSFRQSGKECAQTIGSILGAESEREEQKLLIYEIDFFSGDNFEANGRLELCDDCLWKWISLDFWMETRGRFKQPEEVRIEYSPENYKQKSFESFQTEIENLVNEYKSNLENGDFSRASQTKAKLRAVNDAWNQKSNDVWQEAEQAFREKDSNNLEQKQEQRGEYFWLEEERERRKVQQELVNKNYEKRKQFYMNLFANYDKKESYVEQRQFEKRLVEEFMTIGRESCDNNQDDNNNGEIDCADDECGGKLCGTEKISISEGNETKESVRELFCIKEQCVAREKVEEKMPICGNKICEANESEICKEDCSVCPENPPIECKGKVIFKGVDQNGCQLGLVCVAEEQSCTKNEDCSQPLCGKSECVENKCQTTALEECRQTECIEGDKKVQICESREQLTTEICEQGVWKKTGIECLAGAGEEREEREEIVANECTVKEDCGGSDNVCSNGQCVVIPQTVETENEITEPAENPPEEQERIDENQDITSEQTSETETVETETPPQEQTSETENQETNEANPQEITGSAVRDVFKKITGFVISAFSVEGGEEGQSPAAEQPIAEQPAVEQQSSEIQVPQEQTSETQGPPQEQTSGSQSTPSDEQRDGQENIVKNEERNIDEENARQRKEDEFRDKDRREREEGESKERMKECKDNCDRECKNRFAMPCISQCVFKDNKESDLEECKKKCEAEKETEISGCENECTSSCEKGEWYDFSKMAEPEQKQESGVFVAGGVCRKMPGRETEGHIYFSGWGKPFERIQQLKEKYYSHGEGDWCKIEFDNLVRQRKEIENGFNQEFIVWFFEKYLAGSAEDWEQHVSGIFEVYWRIVENQRELVNRGKCADLPMPDFNLINLSYTTEYGSIEFWEERKNVDLPEFGGNAELISPYMKIWIFPSKEFIEYEMKKAMKEHEFPGPSEERTERKNGEGPTDEEKQGIKMNEKFMQKITDIADKYGGNAQASVQFKDYETGEIVFNLYVQVNENDILLMQPMLPEEVPEKDMTITIDFDKVYELIKIGEKDMQGTRIESPPWDKKENLVGSFNEVKNGVKMFFKVRELISSSEVEPEEAKKDINSLTKSFIWMMVQGGEKDRGMNENGGGNADAEGKKSAKNEMRNIGEGEEGITAKAILGR